MADPEEKRRRIGHTFIEVFEAEAKKVGPDVGFLVQGTLYPDVIESVSPRGGPSVTIKTHHNVGGLPERLPFKLIEPLRELFKDEVRQVGRELGLPEEMVGRHPFPGPGLAIRILGEVTAPGLQVLRRADHIYIEEIRAAGLYDKIWQAFAVLLPIRSVGVQGDGRTYDQVVALRAVTSRDGMTADWFPLPAEVLARAANRISNEVDGVNRVVYDVSSKPPATIEWERGSASPHGCCPRCWWRPLCSSTCTVSRFHPSTSTTNGITPTRPRNVSGAMWTHIVGTGRRLGRRWATPGITRRSGFTSSPRASRSGGIVRSAGGSPVRCSVLRASCWCGRSGAG